VSDLLPFIIIGVVSGSVYGLAAVGLVLSYRTSGIFNFAHGALATLSAYVFYALHIAGSVSWPIAAIISVIILGPALGISFERYARVLSRASLIMQVAGTVGVLLVIEALCTQWYGSNGAFYPNFLPQTAVKVGGAFVTVDEFIVVGVSIALTAGLYWMLHATRLGKAMRAVVDDPDLLAIAGTSPVSVRRAAWVIGCFFATLSGILLAPDVGLEASALTLLVVQAFGAAAIGRFRSLPMTWLGGVIIGVASSVATKYFTSRSILSGIPTALPFIILFVALLLVRQRGGLESAARRLHEGYGARRLPAQIQAPGALVVLGVLIAVPWLFPSYLTAWMTVLCDVILFLSLGLLVRASRQVSLCQVTFAAIGAVAFSKLAGAGVPWVPALLLSGVVVVPIGALLAIPAVRLSGLYLALATFGFGLLVQAMFYQSSVGFGIADLGLAMPRPSWLGLSGDRGFYFLLLALAVATSGLVIWLVHGRLGGLLRMLGSSPLTLEAFGVNVTVTRILVFCISAFIAAIAGALAGCALGTVTGSNYDPNMSLTLMVVVAIVVGGEPWYALVAALLVGLIPAYLTSQTATDVLQLLFGLGAILFSLGIAPKTPPPLAARIERMRIAASRRRQRPAAEQAGLRSPVPAATLRAEEVTVRFGGLVAVNAVSVVATTGRITGVIGPNGAGKTTLFNACSGLVAPAGGRVLLDGRSLARRRPSARARLGLGRSFQHVQLGETLSVAENVRIGAEAGIVGASVLRHVIRRAAERRAVDVRSADALAACGIEELAPCVVSTLSTGQRRLVELARCLAGSFRILLLDEPSSGLDAAETEVFGQLLRRVVAERGIGILLIEHDLSLTMSVCDELYVLDFGRVIHQGTPRSARDSQTVQSAYLGDAVLQS
jgi:ABC-type branched-subunit amino acid transport system ATPase component/branched-subunit amino acid ABC-type transport system permease component